MNLSRASGFRQLKVSASIVLGFNVILAAWLIVRPAGHARIVGVDDIMQTFGPLLGVLLFFAMSHRLYGGASGTAPERPKRDLHGWSSAFLALGALSFAVGQGIWAYYELVLDHPTPFPSLADAGYLSAYPFLFIGVLLLPVRHTSLTSRTRVLLDGTLIMTAVVTFSWYFVLGPTLNQGGETLLAKTVGSAYPLCDLVLGFCLLLLVARSGSVHLRLATRILATGLVAIVVTDSVFDYQTLQGTYATGGLVDVGWPLGYMLICLGALAARATTAPETAEAERDPEAMAARSPRAAMPAWYSLAPYALVPLVGALMVYVGRAPGDPVVDPGVYIGGAVVIGVVLVRQILTIQENRQLHEETVAYAGQIRAAQDELQRKNEGLAEANVRLEALATTDPLTGLPNHRAMIAALDHEVERAHRYNRPFSLLFVDIDHFKTLNDTFGHSVGDDALREFASIARVALRGADILGRWGGEEFVAILPETDPDGAMDVAERLRSQTADSTLPTANGHRLTCSIGIAHFPNDAPDRGLLIERADRAMYAAKRLGRNQARLTSDPAVAALAVGTAAPEVADQSAMIGMVRALALLVEARDQSTGHHGDDVACLATELAQSLGLSDADVYVLRLAAWLHDIGKVAVPDAVLLKPARLTTEEWALMRAHPAVGADVVECVPGLRAIAPIIRAHHERWDGQGYPDGVAGAEIPLAARIICVADAFLTITSDRPYQRARSVEEARAEMRRCSGSQFDPEVVEALEALLEQKPPFLRAG